MPAKRRNWVNAVICVVVVISLAMWLTHDNEPDYHGKPLSYWVVQLCSMHPSSHDSRVEAEEAVRQIGTNAIPYLLKWICYEPPSSRPIPELMESLINQMPRPARNHVPDSVSDWIEGNWTMAKAYGAPEAFALLGRPAEVAIPDLEKLMYDHSKTNTCIVAIYCLAALGTNAIPEIITRLADPSDQLRRSSIEAVAFFPALRTNAQPLVPHLVRCLDDREKYVRSLAAYTLGKIAEADQSQATLVVPALVKCLDPSCPENLRCSAVNALAYYGPAARTALAALHPLLDASNLALRQRTTNALLAIAPELLLNAPPQ